MKGLKGGVQTTKWYIHINPLQDKIGRGSETVFFKIKNKV
jgi:hypothetical protein